MTRLIPAALLLVGAGVLGPDRLAAQAPSSPKPTACTLLPKAEVKRHLPWEAMYDQIPLEDRAIGTDGSFCGYPSVNVQLLPSTSSLIEMASKQKGLEKVEGLGDEAFFRNNADRLAELYVKKGKHAVTVQAPASTTPVATLKPGVLSLGKALVAKLP